MNEPKHTPGPWELAKMRLGDSKDRRSGFVVNGPDTAPLPVRVCDLRCNRDTHLAEVNANAHLIAAAPELLKALQACDRVFGAPNPDPVAAFATIEKARATISKALGEA